MPFVKHAPTAAFLAQRRSMRTDRDPVSRANIDRLQSLGNWRSQPPAGGASISQQSGSDNTPTAATPAPPVASATEIVLEGSAAESDVSVGNADANDVSPVHTVAPVSPLDERRDTAMTPGVSRFSLAEFDVSGSISANVAANDVSPAHTAAPGSPLSVRSDTATTWMAHGASLPTSDIPALDLDHDVVSPADTLPPVSQLSTGLNVAATSWTAQPAVDIPANAVATDDVPSASTLPRASQLFARADALAERLIENMNANRLQAAHANLVLLRAENKRAYASFRQEGLATIEQAVYAPAPYLSRRALKRLLSHYGRQLDHWAWCEEKRLNREMFDALRTWPRPSSKLPSRLLPPPSAQTAACWNSIPNVLLPRPRLFDFSDWKPKGECATEGSKFFPRPKPSPAYVEPSSMTVMGM